MRRKTGRAGHKTSAARLAAVQALYEIDLTGARSGQVIDDFIEKRWRSVTLRDPDNTPGEGGRARLPNPDPDFLRTVVEGVRESKADIDQKIALSLDGDWTLERLDTLMRSLLRTFTYELINMPETSVGIMMNEYGDLAHAFFDEKEAKFASGVLFKLAQLVRPEA